MPTRTARKPSKAKRAPARETPQSVRLAGETFVILPELEYLRLCVEAGELSAEDFGDIVESLRLLADPNEKPIPWADVKRSAGLE